MRPERLLVPLLSLAALLPVPARPAPLAARPPVPQVHGPGFQAPLLPPARPPRPVAGAVPVVRVRQGALAGRLVGDGVVRAFRGIPFAAPPLGPLRWRPPAPAAGWPGLRDAGATGSACMQPVSAGLPGVPPSENCLFLNVWTPARPAGTLPVMVFVHGGGFVFGSGGEPAYDGTALARHGVVLVTLNYRLGVFGFLAHPALTREAGTSGNYGLLDQIAALRWVRNNIAAFGGDPERVTLFGESAGGTSVALLLGAPQAAGLFRRAILESPAIGWPLVTREAAERFGAAIGPDPAALRAMPAAALLPWNTRIQPRAPSMAPVPLPFPVVDGAVLPRQPLAALEAAATLPPLLVGDNADEGRAFNRSWQGMSPGRYAPALRAVFGSAAGGEALVLYPAGDPAGIARAGADLVGDGLFYEGARALARLASRRTPTYRYLFTGPVHDRPPTHAAELRFVFGTLPDDAGPRDRALSDIMMRSWTRFAATGDPDCAGLPSWPRAGGADDPALAIGPGPRVVRGFRSRVLDFVARSRSGADQNGLSSRSR